MNGPKSIVGPRVPWFRLAQAVWAILFILAAALLPASQADSRRYLDDFFGPFYALGLRTYYADREVLLDTPWARTGGLADIQRGDAIVAVGGQPVISENSLYHRDDIAAQVAATPGPAVTVRTRSLDGALRDHALVRTPAHMAQAGKAAGLTLGAAWLARDLSGWVQGVALLLASALVFVRRGRDRVAMLMAVGLALGVLQGEVTLIGGYLDLGVWPYALIYSLGGGAFLSAVLLFPSGRLEPRWTRWVFIPVAAWTVLDFALNAGLLKPIRAAANAAVDVGLVLSFALAVAALAARYRALPSGQERQQIRWALFGFLAAVPFIVLSKISSIGLVFGPSVHLWLLAQSSICYAFGIVLFCAGLTVSLLRYRLYDADMVISRSAGYALLTLGLAGLWAGAEKTLEVVFEGQFGHEAGAASAGVAAALAALLVTPAHHRVMHWTEHVFQKQLSKLRRDLPEHVGDLRETASVARILDTVLERVGEGVRAQHAAVVLRNGKAPKVASVRSVERKAVVAWLKSADLPDDELTRERDDELFPLRLPLVVSADGREVVGWLLLGPRPDGSFYGRDELDALKDIADPVARAVHIARQRDRRDAVLKGELAAIRAELASLRAAPAPAAA